MHILHQALAEVALRAWPRTWLWETTQPQESCLGRQASCARPRFRRRPPQNPVDISELARSIRCSFACPLPFAGTRSDDPEDTTRTPAGRWIASCPGPTAAFRAALT